jgi:hypothetical protein
MAPVHQWDDFMDNHPTGVRVPFIIPPNVAADP